MESCHEQVTVWSSPAPYEAQQTAQRLLFQNVFANSLCPYECTRTVRWHGLDEDGEAKVIDGVGLLPAVFTYPGHLDDEAFGIRTFERASTDTIGNRGVLRAFHANRDITMDECQKQFTAQRNVAPHALWVYHNTSDFGLRLGDCIYYLAGSSQLQVGVWRGFYRHAAQVTSLSHFASVNIKEFMGAISGTFEEVACNGDTSLVCVFWSEFDLDPGTDIGCFPNTEGTNIVSPTELLAEMRNSNIQYPPPSPPPPEPPTPPPSPAPPPDEQMCSIRSLPDASFLKDHSNGAPAPPPGSRDALPTNRQTRAVPCWRWDENLLWPPRQAHQDFYEPNPKCAGQSSLAIQWDTAFRQSRLSEKYHHLHNSDDYTGANNGVCEDGGDGDLSGRSAPITMKSGGMSVADSTKVSVCNKANNAEVVTQEYIFTRIEPFIQQDKFPGVGQEIWILDDLITGEGTRNTAIQLEDGRIVGPLKVTEVYRNPCDDGTGANKCVCDWNAALNNVAVCSGHALNSATSDGTYPRQYSYIRAESIVNADADCAIVTQNLNTAGRVSGIKYANSISFSPRTSSVSCGHYTYCNEASCQKGLDGINEKSNDRYEFYECGMRKANYIFAHSNDYCPYGADRSDCGDRDDIVSYGKSSANRCMIQLYTQDSTVGTTQLQNLYPGANSIAVPVFPPAALEVTNPQWTNGECNDRGSSQIILGTCVFGTDSDDCGYRELTMPRGKVFNRAPDNSCPSANNGLCEDQLYYSNVAPNDIEMSGREICIPNTE